MTFGYIMGKNKKLQTKLEELFGIDIRSLAFLRICLALLIICDCISRIANVKAFYTDDGLLPRSVYYEVFTNWYFSLSLIHGSIVWQLVLLFFAVVCAFVLLIGYRTKLAMFLCWLIMMSLNVRNPLILNGGDVLFNILLFWCMFLPLGASYSVDRAMNSSTEEVPKVVLSGGSVALLFQGAFLYLFTAIFKISPEWMSEGSAIYYALNMDQYVRPLGKLLLNFHWLIKILTIAIFYFEILILALLFSPVFTSLIRILVILGIFFMQLSFGLTLDVGYFPYAGFFAVIPFLPSVFWDKLISKLKTKERLGLKIYYDGDCGFCKKLVCIIKELFLIPETEVNAAQSDSSINKDMQSRNSWVVIDCKGHRHYKYEALVYVCGMSPVLKYFVFPMRLMSGLGNKAYELVANNRKLASSFTKPFSFNPLKVKPMFFSNILALFLLLYVLLWNVETLEVTKFKLPKDLKRIGHLLNITQKWNMFGADYLKYDGWHVIQGVKSNGSQVNLMDVSKPVAFNKPDLVLDVYKNKRWKSYLRNLWNPMYESFRPALGNYLCKEWNSKNRDDNALKYLYIYFMKEETEIDIKNPEITKQILFQYTCR